MARKIRSSSNNFGRFVAPDDEAIGGDPETKRDRYSKYLNTADLTLLELDLTQNPSFYYVRAFSSKEFRRLADYFTHLKDDAGEVKLEVLEDVTAEQAFFKSVRGEVLSACFIGCEDHPVVEAQLADNGRVVTKRVKWDIGTEAPPGLVDAMLEDDVLVDTLLTYTMAISHLSEKEKN